MENVPPGAGLVEPLPGGGAGTGTSPAPRFSTPRFLLLGATLVATWLLWDTPVVYPVRILATFLHEISHGLAAVLTGGRIDRITVETDGSGVCWTAGGWRFAILPAGYLGSMVWGSLILIGACRTRYDKLIAFLLGAGLLLICLFYVRSAFGFFFGLLIGGALAAMGIWLSEKASEFVLVFVGTVSCLYAIFDIRTLWQVSGTGHNDADSFSREILPLPPGVWAVLWGLLAVAVLAVTLWVALRGPAPGGNAPPPDAAPAA
jgi:hypothetical protein